MTAERYSALDLARGFALLGVALVNVHAIAVGWTSHYALNFAEHWVDVAAEYVVGVFFAHRAFPTLAFLFGAGIAFQWQRLQRSQATRAAEINAGESALFQESHSHLESRATLRARYFALLLLGVAQGFLIWPGDIVSSYAAIALLLLPFWPRTDAQWLKGACVLGAIALSLYVLVTLVAPMSAEDIARFAAMPDAPTSYAQAGWRAAQRLRVSEFFSYGIIQMMLPEVWLAIVLGIWCVQSGRLTRWLASESRLTPWFALGFALLLFGTLIELYAVRQGAWDYSFNGGLNHPTMVLALPFTAAGSVFALLWIARAWSAADACGGSMMRPVRETLTAAGKTPLTQFFGQSLLFAVVFNESMIGWQGELGRAAYSLTALLAFVLLAQFAHAWLAAGHARGPMEMLWMWLANALRSQRVTTRFK